MTTNYIIHIIETNTDLKVTYRDKQFRKLEHLRGPINDATFKVLWRIVPRIETHFNALTTQFDGKVQYNLETKPKSLYTLFVEAWYSFYESFAGMPPKFTGTDGKSIKSIIAYLTKLTGNETEAFAVWELLLNKWDTLNYFHKENTDLKYINSKLNIILHAIKQQNNTVASSPNGSIEL